MIPQAITAAWSTKRLWQECVRSSNLRPQQKALLEAIGRHYDPAGLASKMSYTQLAREAGTCVRTAKSYVRLMNGTWFTVTKFAGYKHSKGRCNLYDAILPEAWLQVAVHNLQLVQESGKHNCGEVQTASATTTKSALVAPPTCTRTSTRKTEVTIEGISSTSQVGINLHAREATNVVDFAAARARLGRMLSDRRAQA